MSSDIRNPTFFDQLGEDSENDENSDDDACDDVNDYLSDEETVFSTQTIDSSNLTDIYGNTVEGATDEDEDEAVEEGGQSEPSDSEIAANNAINNTSTNTSNDDPEGESIPIPSGRSIAHHHIADNKAVILSLDIETAGEYVGIVQLSCEIVRFTLVPGRKVNNDTIANVTRVSTNWYINPNVDAKYWSEKHMEVHNIRPTDIRIVEADDMSIVWRQFEMWVDQNTNPDDTIILAAWNGGTCDLKWMWRLTQAPNSQYHLPPKIKYYIDPYRVIKHYTTCKLNMKHSKLEAYEVGSVWKHITGQNLNGAHDSLIDTKAQTDIIIHPHFALFINRTFTVQTIDEMFSKTQQNEWKKELEPNRPVHKPWKEITKDDNVEWVPPERDSYTGALGGPPAGPSRYIIDVASGTKSLASIFLAILPLTFFAPLLQS